MPRIPVPPVTTDGTPLRELGATEDIYYRFDSVCPLYFGVITRFSGPLPDMETLRAAWNAVRARHPLLHARIMLNAKQVPWFVTTDADMELDMIERRDCTQEDAFRMLEESLITKFDDTERGPLVRCKVLQHAGDNDFSLVTTYHHAISDGRSATYVMRDLLVSLAQMERGESADLEPLELVEYYGDRIHTLRSYTGWTDFIKTVSKTCSTGLLFVGRGGVLTGPHGEGGSEKRVPLSEQALLIEPRYINPDDMGNVLRATKQHGVTMQCVLNAALSMTVALDNETRRYNATACTQVLDVRSRLMPAVGEDCGLFCTGNTSIHRIGHTTDFWELAKEISKGLKDALETPLPFFHPAIHDCYKEIAQGVGERHSGRFSKVISQLHSEGLAVSNLGRVRIDVPPDSKLKPTGFAFATNTNVLNYFNTSAASCEGQLTWSFSASSIFGREKLAEIADSSVQLILDNCS